MTPTGAEKWAGKKAWEWIAKQWKRYAELEKRVEALEIALGKHPADACLYCGERAMRLKWVSMVKGEPGKQWQEEDWLCGACGKTHMRPFKLK